MRKKHGLMDAAKKSKFVAYYLDAELALEERFEECEARVKGMSIRSIRERDPSRALCSFQY